MSLLPFVCLIVKMKNEKEHLKKKKKYKRYLQKAIKVILEVADVCLTQLCIAWPKKLSGFSE